MRSATVLFGSLLILSLATPATSAVTCEFDADSNLVTVTMNEDDDEARILRAGDAITVNGNLCGETVLNTDTIEVVEEPPPFGFRNTSVVISLMGGPFAPGVENETGGSDEIEFEVALGDDFADGISITGSGVVDTLRFGRAGGSLPSLINLNADEVDGIDADVSTDTPNLRADGGAGNDRISAAGGAGTGSAAQGLVGLLGGDGDDELRGDGVLLGEAGRDELRAIVGAFLLNGGAGGDLLVGGPSGERMNGGAGRDELRGRGGDDIMRGGSGSDDLLGQTGDDVLNGGPGNDLCRGGPGDDTERGCER